MERWDINALQLFQYVKQGLEPHYGLDKPVFPPDAPEDTHMIAEPCKKVGAEEEEINVFSWTNYEMSESEEEATGALHTLINSIYKMDQVEESVPYYTKLISDYPESKFVKKAQDRMEEIEKKNLIA